ncbi:MAG: ATP-binding protein [Dehalococcoidales bacterium]|nr:ATP-binding protein [Dehalococcoidales bacterium]
MTLWFKSTKFKLAATYSFSLLAVLLASGVVSWAMLSYGLHHNLGESMEADAEVARTAIIQGGYDNLDQKLAELTDSLASSVFIYNVFTKEVFGDESRHSDIQAYLANITDWPGDMWSQTMDLPDGKSRLQASPLDLDEEPGKLLVIARDTSYISSATSLYKTILLVSAPVALIVSSLLGYGLASHSTSQIRAIQNTVASIDPSSMTERIPVNNNDELGELSQALNAALDRIDGFTKRQRTFVEDAAHDLRSPLTNIKVQTELALEREREAAYYRHAFASVGEDVEKMESMIEDLLILASLDIEPARSHSISFDLSGIIESILDNWEADCNHKGIKLERFISPGIWINGEPLDFQRLAGNLIENAFKATSNGNITVTLSENDGVVSLKVADTGCGIPSEHLEKIFWRFYRVDRDSGGNGLGLPIVEGIANMYGGKVEVESEVHKGSVFTVIIPLS